MIRTHSKWLLVALVFFGCSTCLLAATVNVDTPASASISVDTAGTGGTGAYTTLPSMVITEIDSGTIDVGTIIFTAPAGFQFNPAATVTVTPVSGTGQNTTFQSTTVTPTTSTITFNVTAPGGAGPQDQTSCTFSNIQVRPVANHSLPYSGQITESGTSLSAATITYSSASDKFGLLTLTAGAAASIAINAGNNQNATVNQLVSINPSVIVRDQFNNVVQGAPVTFAVNSGGGSIDSNQANQTTNASGIATLVNGWRLGTTAGTNNNTLTATSTGLTGSPLTFQATAKADVAAKITIAAGDGQSAVVGNPVATAPCVLATDAFNNPVSGVAVTFAVATGGGSVSVSSNPLITSASGLAVTNSWTLGNTTGSNTLTATANGLQNSPLTFHATGTAGSATQWVVTAASPATAGSGDVLTAQVADQFGNAVSTQNVTVSWSTDTGALTTPTSSTNPQGQATDTLTLSQTAGVVHTVTASGGGLTDGQLMLTSVAGPATQISISAGDNQSAAAGTAVPIAPSVLVQDQYANPVAGTTVMFAAATGGGSVTGGNPTSNAAGIATVGSWVLGATAGPNTLTATSTGLTNSPLTFNATGQVGAASKFVFSQLPASLVANGTNNATFTLTVTDANNNPIGNTGVTMTTTLGTITNPATTGGSGIAFPKITTGTVSGTATITASIGNASGTATIQFLPGPAAQISIASGNNQSATVGTTVSTPVCVSVQDVNGNGVPGTTVTYAVATGSGLITGATPTSDSTGIATLGSWTLGNIAGSNTLTASVQGLTNSPLTFTATGTAGPAKTMVIAAGDGQTATAGTSVPVQPCVRITDQYNNPVSGVSVTFAVASGGGSITGASQSTNAAGIAVVGSWTLGKTAGANTLSVTSANLSPITFTATGVAGTAAKYVLTPATQTPAAAGNVVVSAQLADINGNAIGTSGLSLNWAISGGGSLSATSSSTNAQGIATNTLTLPSSISQTPVVTATDTAGLTGQVTITAVAAAVKSLLITAPVFVSSGAASDVTVTAQDQFGNPNKTYTGTIQFTSSDTAANLPANYTFVAGDNGAKTFSGGVTLKASGVQSVTATDISSGSITGSTNVTVGPSGGATAITSGPNSNVAEALPGTPITFNSATFSGFTLSWDFGDGTTDNTNSGTVSHTYAAAGSYTVTVTATDPQGGKTSKTLSVVVVGSAVQLDTNGNGIVDDIENTLGGTFDFTGPFTQATANISKVAIKLSFAKTGSDSIQLTGSLPIPSGFTPTGKTIAFDFGSVVEGFTMDKTGKGSSGKSTFKLTIKKGSSTANYMAKFTGAFVKSLANDGLDGTNAVKNAPRSIFVQIVFLNGIYNTMQTISFTATPGKTGTGK